MNRILITGASSPLGLMMAELLAKQKVALLLHYHRHKDQLQQLQSNYPFIELVQADFAIEASVHNCIQKALHYPVTGIIHNAASYLYHSSYSNTQLPLAKQLWDINYFAPYSINQALIPSLPQGGRIVHLGVAGLNHMRGSCYMSVYHATKIALLHLTRSLAQEHSHISVNMVSPSFLPYSQDQVSASYEVSTEEVASMVLHCFSPSFRSVTGQNIEVAKGWGL